MTEQYPDEGFRKIGDYFISIKKVPVAFAKGKYLYRVRIKSEGKTVFTDRYHDKEAAWDSINHFVEDKKNGR